VCDAATLVKNWEHEVKTWLGDERLACCVIQGGQADAKEQVGRVRVMNAKMLSVSRLQLTQAMTIVKSGDCATTLKP
jgi:hypothetical protein